jgi:hypothetical protein
LQVIFNENKSIGEEIERYTKNKFDMCSDNRIKMSESTVGNSSVHSVPCLCSRCSLQLALQAGGVEFDQFSVTHAVQKTYMMCADLWAGIMTEGTRVRDLLPRAPARLSKQIDIGDVILAVDNQPVTNTKEVLEKLRGSDVGRPHTQSHPTSLWLCMTD